ncbi:hypothetical protein FKM52_09375 [Mixta tenebrionis]|uniref:Uncharacterized protein n=1 Tax=Mixta tenebrionis TaxID=2562439 RepID=A0A506V9D9_9GAMM|nr:hypothetical protein FKM52_09375 [Mixta tenebrionis]
MPRRGWRRHHHRFSALSRSVAAYAFSARLISTKHIHILFPSFLAKLEKVCSQGFPKFIQLRTGYEQDL